jgi:uncharacterized lipoprotein YmbA
LTASLAPRAIAAVGLMIQLAGCGSSIPIRSYELGGLAPAATGTTSEAGLPVVELKTVTVPDYLDSSDILRRSGANELIASPSGRWGERLSLGLTHALASSLARRLPHEVITTNAGAEPTRRLVVDVESFEIGADGGCLLSARWRFAAADGAAAAPGEHGSFSEAAGMSDDAAAAAAMSRAVDQLAEQIAATVRRALPNQQR